MTGARRRVVYVSMDAPVPARGGYAVRVQTVAEALSRVADFRLLCLMQLDDREAIEATSARFDADYVIAHPRGKAGKGLLHARATFANRNRWMEKFRTASTRAQAVTALQRFDPDLVVFGQTAMSDLGAFYGVAPERTVIDHHNVESRNYTRIRQVRKGLGKLTAAIDARAMHRHEREAAALADHWAVSDVDGEALSRILGRAVLTVPNCAPDRAFALTNRGTRADAPAAVGFMASYHYYPNVEAALELCAIVERLRADGVSLSATAMGKDPPGHLVRAADHAGVTLPGFVDDPSALQESFTVLLAPIRSGAGTKLKIIEALAMGIPVVTTELGSEGIPIAREAMGIVTDDAGALAAATRMLLEDRAKAAAMGQAGRRWAAANASVDALTAIVGRRIEALSAAA